MNEQTTTQDGHRPAARIPRAQALAALHARVARFGTASIDHQVLEARARRMRRLVMAAIWRRMRFGAAQAIDALVCRICVYLSGRSLSTRSVLPQAR